MWKPKNFTALAKFKIEDPIFDMCQVSNFIWCSSYNNVVIIGVEKGSGLFGKGTDFVGENNIIFFQERI